MRAACLLAVTAGVTAVAASAPAAAYADDTTAPVCSAQLPAWVEGQPAHVHARAATGDYLWHDADGWHLRVTHPTKKRLVFTGRVTASSPITFARVRDESHDRTALSDDGRTLTFRFVNYGGIDGVDFTDACAATTTFAFAINGHRGPLDRLYVGAHSSRPRSNPFTISRQDSSSAA